MPLDGFTSLRLGALAHHLENLFEPIHMLLGLVAVGREGELPVPLTWPPSQFRQSLENFGAQRNKYPSKYREKRSLRFFQFSHDALLRYDYVKRRVCRNSTPILERLLVISVCSHGAPRVKPALFFRLTSRQHEGVYEFSLSI